jgi:hypothetical protein
VYPFKARSVIDDHFWHIILAIMCSDAPKSWRDNTKATHRFNSLNG